MNESPSALEKQLENLLCEMGRQGTLDSELADRDLDLLLAAAPGVSLSTDFAQRATKAMAQAQRKREQGNPAITLGTAIAQARRRTGLELSGVAVQIGVAVGALEALELGQLSVRQILRNFPPAVAAQLLRTVKLAVQEFSGRLMGFAAHGGTASGFAVPQLVHRQRRAGSESPIEEVAQYIATLEDLMQLD